MIITELQGDKRRIEFDKGILSLQFPDSPEIWIGENTMRDAIFYWLDNKTDKYVNQQSRKLPEFLP